MVRASIPGGSLSGEQYLVCDELADWVGDGTLRITSRQGLQWHHIRKGGLRGLVWTLNQSLVTTLGACGDVVRNVVSCPMPRGDGLDLSAWAGRLARHFRPRTEAYWEIWIDGERTISAHPSTGGEVEPVYGETYLPRKFKIGLAAFGDNCVDVHTHDVGLVPLGDGEAFTVLVGGGQGRSHNRPDTYPRLADPFTTVATGDVLDVVEAIVCVQRDHGDRTDRKHARLKYLVDSWGLAEFRAAVQRHLGRPLPQAEAPRWASHTDHLGWHPETGGRWILGIPVENGRIADQGGLSLRSGLREVVDRFRPEVLLTPQQNLLLSGIASADRAPVDALLASHAIPTAQSIPLVIRDAMACVALPTCGLALSDAERALPALIREMQATLDDLGLGGESIGVRMTGCPNGCARPYSTEIGLVGRRRACFDVHLGGAADGTRLNELAFEVVPADRIISSLRPVLLAWRDERTSGESFGDFCHRLGSEVLRRRFATTVGAPS